MDRALEDFLSEKLEEISRRSLRRHLQALEGPQGIKVRRDGRELLNFSSNDYLGLANDCRLQADARVAEFFEWLCGGAWNDSCAVWCR